MEKPKSFTIRTPQSLQHNKSKSLRQTPLIQASPKQNLKMITKGSITTSSVERILSHKTSVPTLHTSYSNFNSNLKPLSSQRVSRQQNKTTTTGTNFFLDYPKNSVTSFDATEKSRLPTYGSDNYFNLIESEAERVARFNKKIAPILKKRAEIQSLHFWDETKKEQFIRMMFYLKEFY